MRGEKLMSLTQAVEWLASELGLERNRQSIYRWAYYGVQGCKLEVVSIAGQWFTSGPALRRFLAACTRRHNSESGANINELQL